MPSSLQYLEKMLLNKNVQAAIATIRFTEGTSAPDGYYYLYGSSPRNTLRFKDLSKHPNNKQRHNNITSTAAGIAQIIYPTWVTLSALYGFKDFSEHTQHLAFVALFDDAGVLKAIADGGILRVEVLGKLSKIWASLPLATFGQPTHDIASVRKVYVGNGGEFG